MKQSLVSFRTASREILSSVRESLDTVSPRQVEKMVQILLAERRRRILILGVGRSGLVGRAFAMRLMHLGFNVYVMGETITPAIGKGDLIIAISGSGTTKLAVTAATIGKEVQAKIVAITSYPNSNLGRLANHTVHLSGRTKLARERDYFLRQITGVHEPLAPLGTIFEIACFIFLDSLIVELMRRIGKTEVSLKKQHATIE